MTLPGDLYPASGGFSLSWILTFKKSFLLLGNEPTVWQTSDVLKNDLVNIKSHAREKPLSAIHSTKISENFGPKLNGSVRSNRKSFEKTGPSFEVDHFSRSDRLEFWLNGSRPLLAG